jgi:mannosyl-3-phosphoglycerate phosphatase
LFSDLDGTLLDHDTYQPSGHALATVAQLAAEGVQTIPVSSKTAAEILVIFAGVELGEIGVAEGGPVIVSRAGDVEIVGPDRSRLIQVLRQLQREGWPLRGFSEMTESELVERTGLEMDAAASAMDRRASEPFVVEGPLAVDVDRLVARAAELGAGVTRGGRFWHLLGSGIDKGRGVDEVVARIASEPRPPTGAVGDAWNDLPMFERVDRGYLLGTAVADDELPPKAIRIPMIGPEGFVRAAAEFRRFCEGGRGMPGRRSSVATS